jgi:fucose permease
LEKITASKNYAKLSVIILAYVAFIALGMPDGLLGIAWPTMRVDFGIPLDSLGMLLFASVSGYMTSSFLSGTLISRMGVGSLLTVSCLLTGSALVGYTLVPTWWMMVLLGVTAGLGAGAIDAGLNTYVASHFGEGLMQWLHASYGIGVTIGPVIMTTALTVFHSWRMGYRVVGGFQFFMALAFVLTLALWNAHENTPAEGEREKRLTEYKTPIALTMRQPRVWLSVLLFFLYVGGEVSLGTWVFSLLTESRGISTQAAGLWAGSFWATFTIGRILAGLYAQRLGIHALVQGGLALALLGALLLWWHPFELANLLAVGLIGVAVAPIFPAMMSGTSQRVGAHFAANTIGMQMAATGLGGATIPSLIGVLARQFSLEVIPVCLVVVFALLLVVYRLASVKRPSQEVEHVAH